MNLWITSHFTNVHNDGVEFVLAKLIRKIFLQVVIKICELNFSSIIARIHKIERKNSNKPKKFKGKNSPQIQPLPKFIVPKFLQNTH